MPESSQTNITEEISLLYELSLAIGSSLDLEENCDRFLRTLMARKNLGFAAVWLRSDLLPERSREASFIPVYAHPVYQADMAGLSPDDPVFDAIGSEPYIVIPAHCPAAAQVLSEKRAARGQLLLFALNDLGLLVLHSPRSAPYEDVELRQLWNVVKKFRVSLEACLAHERTLHEVRERARAETALRSSEQKYRTLVEMAGDAIFLVDAETGRVLEANRRAQELLEGDASDFKDVELKTFFSTSDWERVRSSCEALHNRGVKTTRVDRVSMVTLNDAPLLVDFSCTELDIDGRALYQIVVRDISERIEAEKERRKLEAQLLQAQKMESIGRLAGGIAHDFNNILSSILGYASYIKNELEASHEFFSYLQRIEQSAERAGDMTTQLLAFARGGKYKAEPVDLNEIVERTLDILDVSLDKTIRLDTNLDTALPAVIADPVQLQQVILNLCMNAREAMPQGGRLTIGTRAVQLGTEEAEELNLEPGVHVEVVVTDTGYGMDAATRDRIFEPFFTTKEEGTGLGLAMVYGVVSNHDGIVSVESEPGEGTTIKALLPATRDVVTTEPVREEEPQVFEGMETLLFVDDEEFVRGLVELVLESHGYRVLLARDGEEALKLYEAHQNEIALVILDLVMPRMDGKHAFRELQRRDPDVKVILTTGYSDEEEARELLRTGALDILEKPFRSSVLLSHVRRALDENVRSRTDPAKPH